MILVQSLLASYPDQVAHLDGDTYHTADGNQAEISGISSLYKKKMHFICYIEMEVVNEKNKMRGVFKILPEWLSVAGSPIFCERSEPHSGEYRPKSDLVVCTVKCSYGSSNWTIPEATIRHPNPYPFFAAALLEGHVFDGLRELSSKLASKPANIIKNQINDQKLMMIVHRLSQNEISSKKLMKIKLVEDQQFLLKEYLYWIPERIHQDRAIDIWASMNK